jgi:hypothetical protein
MAEILLKALFHILKSQSLGILKSYSLKFK